jgi:hypothetical protein
MGKAFPQLGFHYYPDDRHYTDQDLSTWLPILASLGASWLTVRGSARRAIPENFIKGLIETGIEPIIHIPHPVGKLDESYLRPILESYSRWGARFVIIYDRPNLREHWANDAWHKKGLVERFVDFAVPTLHLVRASGLAPVLPPLEPGGDYWDTAFLEGVLQSLHRRRNKSLLRDLHISFYAWTNDRPIDWGIGGPEKWENARPYLAIDDVQDHRGFRIFDWYDAIALRVAGELMPLICVGGGINQRITPVNPGRHEETILSIVHTLESGDLPTTVRNINFYLLACESTHVDVENAWFPSIDSPISSVNAIRKYISRNKQAVRKPLRHYLLLPDGTEIQDIVSHIEVASILRKYSPVVGYSPFEAQLAQTVTLYGDEDDFGATIGKDLENSGCKVKRLLPESEPKIHLEDEYKDKQDHIQAIIERVVAENGGREK